MQGSRYEASWGASGIPAVLPAGYGQVGYDQAGKPVPLAARGTPMDRGGPNLGPGLSNAAQAPGWMTAGPGVEEIGAYGAAKTANPSRDVGDTDGQWRYRQFKDETIQIIGAPATGQKWVGQTVSPTAHNEMWTAIVAQIGTFADYNKNKTANILTGIASGLSSGISAATQKPKTFKKSKVSDAQFPVAAPVTDMAPPSSVPWGWILGGGAVLVGGIVLYSIFSAPAKSGGK